MFDQANANSTQASFASSQRTKKSPKTGRKTGSSEKSTTEDWPTAIRHGFGAGLALLGEYLQQAGQELSQGKPALRKRK